MSVTSENIVELLYRKARAIQRAEDANPEVGMGMPLFYIVEVAREQLEKECELLGVDYPITEKEMNEVETKLRRGE